MDDGVAYIVQGVDFLVSNVGVHNRVGEGWPGTEKHRVMGYI